MSLKAIITKEELYQDYIIDKLSIYKIYTKYKTSYETIHNYLKEYNIELRLPHLYVGKKQGKLLLKEKIGGGRKSRNTKYLCECECGNIQWLGYKFLAENKRQCCGCVKPIKCDNEIICGEIKRSCWNYFIANAKSAERKFDLLPEQIWDMYEKQDRKCYYTKLPITFKFGASSHAMTASLDRINNLIDYEIDNIRIVHKCVNMLRGAADVDAFVYICNKVAENHSLIFNTEDKTLVMKKYHVISLE